ncbi:MAG: UDP-N-acetylmuramoyl-L-alanyl-D-glutamate--2,6-diaminopimelate ligase [Ignavibacteria bacterium]|nr:UDP-N-acetylmuramoyl-L-alanyl-D-glutamate--2,6-diaminopimelate ligase [Ignavibacteria bacterium]
MKVTELLKISGVKDVIINNDFDVAGLSFDSRQVRENYIFFAVKGSKQNGNEFIESALKNGAKLIICSDDSVKVPDGTDVIISSNIRKTMAEMSCGYYGNPSARLKVIGITGTNGKTTISYLIKHILEDAGFKSGLIGTIDYISESGKKTEAKLTTPDSVDMNRFLCEMADNQMDFCVMEVSSIALTNYRVHTINYDTAVFTNLTSEHMDLHHNMENYFHAKQILFNTLSGKSLAVSNADDLYGKRILGNFCGESKYYSITDDSDYKAENVRLNLRGLSFDLKLENKIYKIESELTGKFNIYNILSCIPVCRRYGIAIDDIVGSIRTFRAVKGRFNRITLKNNAFAIIDYSHTSDSLKNAVEAAVEIRNAEYPDSRVITVFGCGGDKDKSKRPVMGRIASDLSDIVIITSDNPRTENPQSIIDDIKKGITDKSNCIEEVNREIAIKKSLELSEKGDIILICGKGHETYQEINGVRTHFDDEEMVFKYNEFIS